MKKMLLMLLAGVSMSVALSSCENPEDPNKYCWEVSYRYTDIQGLEQEDDTDMVMTVKEKNDLLDNGKISIFGFDAEIIRIKKQSNDECSLID